MKLGGNFAVAWNGERKGGEGMRGNSAFLRRRGNFISRFPLTVAEKKENGRRVQNRNSVCQQKARIRLLELRSGWMRFAATANKRRIFVIMARGSSLGW